MFLIYLILNDCTDYVKTNRCKLFNQYNLLIKSV